LRDPKQYGLKKKLEIDPSLSLFESGIERQNTDDDDDDDDDDDGTTTVEKKKKKKK